MKGDPGLLLAFLPLLVAAADARAQGALWIADDTTARIYRVTEQGALISSFPVPFSAHSSVDLDPFTLTLWATSENAGGGRFVNTDRAGQLPPGCGACEPFIGAAGLGISDPEGLGVDPADGTLWAVADPLNVGMVYHLERDGTLLSSFPTASFDAAAISPQSICVDPFDGTLWITDNESRKIYNVTKTGSLVSSFSALLYTAVFDPGVSNPIPQGIGVDADGSLWVTDRLTNRIYNVDSGRGGTTPGNLRSSFPSTTYDEDSHNPTGVAYEAPLPVPALPEWGAPALSLGLLAAGRRVSGLRPGSQRGTRSQYSA